MGDEKLKRLVLGKVQTAPAGDKEFPTDGCFGVEKRHRSAASRGDFSGPQTCRAAADDGDFHLSTHYS
jgi:hypothetical protein